MLYCTMLYDVEKIGCIIAMKLSYCQFVTRSVKLDTQFMFLSID